jgi:hypothetical protein
LEQTVPAAQLFPQAPQLAPSVVSRTQVPLQATLPGRQSDLLQAASEATTAQRIAE